MKYTSVRLQDLGDLNHRERQHIETGGYLVDNLLGSGWGLAPSQEEKEKVIIYLKPLDGATLCTFIDLVYPRKGVKDGVQAPEKDSPNRNITVQGVIDIGVLCECTIVKPKK